MCQICEEMVPLAVNLNDTARMKILALALRSLFTKTDLFVSAVELPAREGEILSHMMRACLGEDRICDDSSIKLELLDDCSHASRCCRRFTFAKFDNAYLTVTRTACDELLVDDYFIPTYA
jgi:hypothetical protein